jgi:hypothetical protein
MIGCATNGEVRAAESNAQIISANLGFTVEQAEQIADILESVGVGPIKEFTKESDSNDRAYFVTIQDESGAVYFVSMTPYGGVGFISKDDRNGETIYWTAE